MIIYGYYPNKAHQMDKKLESYLEVHLSIYERLFRSYIRFRVEGCIRGWDSTITIPAASARERKA